MRCRADPAKIKDNCVVNAPTNPRLQRVTLSGRGRWDLLVRRKTAERITGRRPDTRTVRRVQQKKQYILMQSRPERRLRGRSSWSGRGEPSLTRGCHSRQTARWQTTFHVLRISRSMKIYPLQASLLILKAAETKIGLIRFLQVVRSRPEPTGSNRICPEPVPVPINAKPG